MPPSSPTPSSSSSLPPKPNNTNLIVAITVSAVGVLLALTVIFATIRLRRRNATPVAKEPGPRPVSRVMSLTHPASKITPFGSADGQSPKFTHSPGSSMRIAKRRPDGAWEFGDPNAPFSPAGISDLDLASTSSLSSFRKGKEDTGKSHHDVESPPETPRHFPPPPAYSSEPNPVPRHLGE